MSQTAEIANDPKPWEIKHDLPPKDAAAYIGVGLSKLYQMFATGEIESYHLGTDGRGGRRAVRESLERVRNRAKSPSQVQQPETQAISA